MPRTSRSCTFRTARETFISAGTSQSGMLQRTFLNGFHKLWRLPGGAPIYDAYLIDVGAAMLRINQCSQDVLAADPFLRVMTRFSVSGEILERTGNSQATTVAETYQCRDGYVRIFVNQPDHWRRFVEWLGRPPELLDPKLENVQDRFPLRQQIDRLVEARSLNYDAKKFFEEFQGLRLAAAPVHSPAGFVADEQTRHRNYLQELEHPYLGNFDFPGDPYRFSETLRRSNPFPSSAISRVSESPSWAKRTVA